MQTQADFEAPRVLAESELDQVGGGLKPQLLPPGAAQRFQYAGTPHSVYVDGLYRGDYYIG